MMFLLIMVFIGIVLFEVPGLIRKRYWRELIAFSLFLLLAFTMTILQAIGVEIPNPLIGMQYVVKDILHLNYK